MKENPAIIKWIWIFIGCSFVAALVAPAAFVLLQTSLLCLLLYLLWGVAGILFSHRRRPVQKKRYKREQVEPSVIRDRPDADWVAQWEARCESPAEVAFLFAAINYFKLEPEDDCLKNSSGRIQIRLQKRIEDFRVDFLLNDKVVIEIDGEAWHGSLEQKQRDAGRDSRLRVLGFSVLRFAAKRAFNQPLEIMEAISSLFPTDTDAVGPVAETATEHSDSKFICPECSAETCGGTIYLDLNLIPSGKGGNPWDAVSQIQTCAECECAIPRHLSERWNGLPVADAGKAWREIYKDCQPTWLKEK
jgi:very-short-patch-repair endonuclease